MHGNVILLTSAKLTSGKIINMIDNKDLTSGKLLHVKSSSSHASNPLQFDFPRVTNGTGITMNVQNLQNGVGILLDIDTGAALRTTHHDTTYDGSGGTLLRLKGQHETSAITLLDIDASSLVDGRAIRVTSLDKLTSGALLDMYTNTSTGHADNGGAGEGVVRLTANEMKSGTAMKINTNMLTDGMALHVTSNDGKMLQSIGTLVYIDGNAESNFIASASMVEVKGRDMTDGTLLKLTHVETSSLTTGKVLDIHTKSSSLMNGAFEVTSNSVETGQIMRIRGDKITSANMIDILSSSSNVNAESQIISINASNALNGSIVDVKSPSLMHGNVILLTSAKLTSGKIINMIDNKDLTSGKLLHVKSSSSHASNPLHMGASKY